MTRRLAADSPDRSAYGARLRAARKALGLTQQQVADRLGLERVYVAKLEAGSPLESWPAFLSMVQALGYDPAIVAPELVNASPLVSRNQVSAQAQPRTAKKTDPQSSQ